MDVIGIIIMFVIISIIDNLTKRKSPRVPPPQRNRDKQPNFDIPTLANDPNRPGEEIPMIVEIPRPAEVRPLNPPPRPIQQLSAQSQRSQFSAQPVRETREVSELDVEFTPSTIVNGFIISELLDKPKALRRRGRRL